MPFDPNSFMQQNVDQPLAFERTICPEGEYRASIDDFDEKAFETFEFTYKQGPRAGQPGSMTKFTCPIIIDSDKARQELQTDKVTIYHEATLDFDETTGALLFGPNKNVELGKLRHATKQNAAGSWNITMLRGAGPFAVKVVHRTIKRKDGSEFDRAVIERMAPIS